MDYSKIKGKLVEKKINYNQAAEYLGISNTSFCNKMNGKSKFYYDEIISLGRLLQMTKEEITEAFLNEIFLIKN